ncbi:unnamed protein product [Ectocarpus sp. CCAP 1310/34]|nr:unnamed protein product [Ectocarpus sp. CCAP 1310/34]
MDDLEDHLDDLLDGGEMEARIGNTIGAARLVAPAAWKANQDVCSEFLGKLDGGSFTTAMVSSECPLLATGIWEAILVEVLDRVLPLAGRHCETETEAHRARVAFAERVVGVLGLRRSSLVTLPGES